ncbi:MAG: hypothetical protein EYC70_09660 [Planctomycetota bacterium]|nr:MAG: hypothetical protein EYC70_09660 [Planctomycetota bacterium]
MRPLHCVLLLASLLWSCATVPGAPSDEERMDWWREARFGMFIHWGLYAIPAGTWGQETGHGEWIMNTAQIPVEEYEKLREQFNPVKFDADEIVTIAKNAGMKYIVITSKHHDGFALFDSAVSDYDVMATPFRRDILRELAEACARQGVRMCWYHSIMDWHHPDYLPRREWEARPAEGADFNRYVQYLHGQVTELLTNYGPIGVMWFDGEWESTWKHEYGQPLYDLCRRLQPSVIVNNRVDVGRGGMGGFTQDAGLAGDFGTPEQEIPAMGVPGVDWETCMTMNDHWGYNSHDKNFKSTRALIRMLVDIASKGGNYLLNVGPTAEGEIPPESVQRLEEIGRWMAVNGAAIHGTVASPFPGLPWGRATLKPGRNPVLYLHVFEWPRDGVLVVPGLGSDPRRVSLLADPARELRWERVESDLRVSVPSSAPDADCTVVALQLAGAPVVYRTPEIRAAGDIFVRFLDVEIAAGTPGVEARYTTDGTDPEAGSESWRGRLRVQESCVVKARAFHRGRPVSAVAERTFTRVAPIPGAAQVQGEPGLRRETFRGDWNRLPDYAAMRPLASEVAAGIAPLAEEYVGLRYRGFVFAPADEVYTLALTADDGACLWIGERLVVDNDGLHSPAEKRGQIALGRGWHPIRVEWFNKTGGYELAVRMGAGAASPGAALELRAAAP